MGSLDVSAFVSYANELEEAAAGAGLTWLKARRTEALATINGAGGSNIISTTVDGQTFTRTISTTAQDMFSVLQVAILQFNGDGVKITYPTFSGIPH